jgi:hypothetical protein
MMGLAQFHHFLFYFIKCDGIDQFHQILCSKLILLHKSDGIDQYHQISLVQIENQYHQIL